MNTNANYFYSLLLFIAGCISLVAMQVAWKRRHLVPYASPLAIFSLGSAWWSLTYALHWTNIPRFSEFFWVDLTYLGVVTIPTAFYVFSLYYSDKAHWLSKRIIILLAIVPVLTLIFLWTDSQFGIFFAGKRGSADAVITQGGLWFWFHIVYSYSLILYGMFIMFRAFYRSPQAYRKQIGILIVGVLIPLATSLFTVFWKNLSLNLDLTPFSFTLTGLLISISVFRFGFLDLRPIAYEILFANLSDAVIVLDDKNRIIDLNPLAENLIGNMLKSPMGRSLEELQELIPEMRTIFVEPKEGQAEFSIPGHPSKYFESALSLVLNRSKVLRGRILTIRDITERKKASLELERVNKELKQTEAALQKLAITDPLIGCFNRRHFFSLAENELIRATRYNHQLSVFMIDIDYFKQVNDTYGHSVGDQVLIAIARRIETFLRSTDIFARYGGEEFVILLPETNDAQAWQIAERLREKVAEPFKVNGLEILVSISLGLSCWRSKDEILLDALLDRADQALYAAKRTGRNQVLAWPISENQ